MYVCMYVYIYMAVCQNARLVHDLVPELYSAHKVEKALCRWRSRTRWRKPCAGGGRAQGVHAQGAHRVRTRYAQGTHKVELNLVQGVVHAQGHR